MFLCLAYSSKESSLSGIFHAKKHLGEDEDLSEEEELSGEGLSGKECSVFHEKLSTFSKK
jgi:hypothetical protein